MNNIESSGGDWSKKLAWMLNAFLLLGSVYIVWGWITTGDIKRYCKENHLDYHDVADKFLTSRITSFSSAREPGETNSSIDVKFRKTLPIERLGIPFSRLQTATTNSVGEPSFDFVEGSMIEPFMAFSDNFLSAIYSFGLGFIIGFVILLSKCLRNSTVPTRVIALRPFVGGCCAACIFLLVLSLGSLLLDGAGEVKPSSLGIIGAMGAIICERFERILREAVPQKLDSLS